MNGIEQHDVLGLRCSDGAEEATYELRREAGLVCGGGGINEMVIRSEWADSMLLAIVDDEPFERASDAIW